MTDNEIVKALGACLHRGCNVCIRRPEEYGATERQCLRGLMKDTLDLINRQKDEIETKDIIIANQGKIIEELLTNMGKVATEAYKECVEKVKEYIDTYEHLACEECECVPIRKDSLDNLLKELVGEQVE